ncbi:MAG: TonB-dependent receptor domain-containing protein [Pyrinomonadaceae bacterium]
MKHKILMSLATFFFLTVLSADLNAQSRLAGIVNDQNGDAVAGARVSVSSETSRAGLTTVTSREGTFSFTALPAGVYRLRVVASGFAVAEQSVQAGVANNVTVTLAVGESHVTVTAEFGQSEEAKNVPQAVNVIGTDQILQRVTSVIAQAGKEEAGLNYQRTSPTIGAIVIRGLTGKNVVNFVDGVRFTHSGQRGGINTFFNLNEPSSMQSIEVLRGPNGAQYGSDSLSGTVNLVTKSPAYGFDKPEWHGEFTPSFSTADRSYGTSALVSYGTRKFGGYFNINGRRIGDVRTAEGLDSHSAITRFLGLPSTALYRVNPETGFEQYGFATKLNYSPREDQQLTFFYQRSQQDHGRRFDQLLGGDGNLIADLRNLMLDFGYLRYTKQNVGTFDNLSITGSYNTQREERVNQGGQGNPVGDITHQYERTSTWGSSAFLDKRFGRSNTFLVGGDFYFEMIKSPAYITNGTTFAVTISRPRIPNGSTFSSGGVFVQDVWDAVPGRLRISGALRYSAMSYKADGSKSPIVAGRQLWLNDSLKTGDMSGRIGAVVRATDELLFAFNYSRGFRYPSMTDLGTLGLTGDGFEVDHLTAGGLGGTIGSTGGSTAVSTGLPVVQQRSEYSNNYDGSVRYTHKRFDTNFTLFRLDIDNAITKQALILPAGAVGKFLGGDVITNQLANGVVFVAASSNPVLVRANFTSATIWGVEYELQARLTNSLMLKGNYTYIRASDKTTGVPPNIEGGTPPPTGFLSLRYNWSRFWVEGYTTLASRQDRLSSGDLADRRTGAPRSRSQIQNYFRRGACVKGLTTPGPTGCGSAGGILTSTSETQAQVQNRLLPIGATINGVTVVNDSTVVPLFTHLPGYGLANVRGGFTINENATIFLAFENIFDQAYRNPSWGIDGTGRSFTGQLRLRF